MPLGRPLGAKLYLEGIEVPFVGATITNTVGQASIAYIDCVPHKEINNIKPRTHVLLAVRDYNNSQDANPPFPYVTAWEGEVFGYSFGKTVGSRTFTLQCIDESSYWDNCLAYFMNTQLSLGKGGLELLPEGLDVNDAKAQGIPVHPTTHSEAAYFLNIIKEATEDPSKDFLDGFIEVYKRISDVNAFYRVAEKRLRIRDRMFLRSSGELKTLLQGEAARNWFEGVVGRASGFSSLRMVVQDLMSLIFHDFVSVPFPARVEKKDLAGQGLQTSDSKKYSIGNFIFKPNLYMIPPPACNIFFPDEYSNFQFSRNFFKEPTRLIYKPELPLFQGAGIVAMPHAYEPESFEHFMLGSGDAAKHVGKEQFQVPESHVNGFYADPDDDPDSSKTNGAVKREGQFLTNEELIKGIWLAQEHMMPAATQFRQELADSAKRPFVKQVAKYLFFKKRFSERQLQITSHLKMSVVPGFNVLLLDESSADQNVVAYCSSVTHRIYATEGGYTNVTLSYARTVAEEQSATKISGEPLVPPWFAKEIFGEIGAPKTKVANKEFQTLGKALVSQSKLSEFYATLLGAKGSKAITDYNVDEPTVLGATRKLLIDYKERKLKGAEEVQSFISTITSRDYVRVRDAMRFIGATIPGGLDLRDSYFFEFKGGAFDPDAADFGSAVKTKQAPLIKYRDALKQFRGFRG